MSTRDWCIAFAVLIALLLFLSPGFAETSDGCWDGTDGAVGHWSLNDTTSPPFVESCYGYDAYNYSGAIDSVVGQFSNAGEFLVADTEYATAPVNIMWNFTFNENYTMCAWAYPLSLGAQGWIVSPIHTKYWMMIQIVANNSYRCLKYDGANPVASVYSNAAAANTWTHICCGTETASDKVFMFINGSFHANVTDTSNAATQSSVNHSFGRWGGGGNNFNGRIDEIFYYNGSGFGVDGYNWATLTSAISNITTYNNVTGIAGAPPAANAGCTITLNTPADNYHTDDTTPLFSQANLTCYGAMPDRCYVTMNGTITGDNTTNPLVNITAFDVLANLSYGGGDGSYEWNISCTNTTWTNTSATRTLVIDTIAPQTFIYAPTPATTLYYGDVAYLDVAANDTYMFNLTAEIFNGTGVTALGTFNNDTGSPPWFNLTNEYVVALDLYPGDYWVNASSMDSHTGKKWKPDQVETDDGYIKVWKNGKSVKSSWLWNAEPDYELLEDRVKWSTVAQCDNNGDIKVKFNVLCSQEVRIIQDSEYAGHYVCGEMWGDFQDLEDTGYDIKVVYESPISLEVEIEKEDAGEAFEWIWLDPATGGLNLNFSLSNFTVLTDSALAVNETTFYVGTQGFLIIYYTNITTDALITGANCSYNITDPYSNLDQGNATEGAAFYLANYTPTFTGLHSFAVMCNSSGWLTLNATGTFSVTSAPATTSIQVVPNSERMWTSATCTNSELAHAYESRVCFGSSCETVTVTEYEFCPLGCLQEGGALCRESLITSNPALVLLIAVILLAIVIFGLYAWARRVK